MQEDISINLSEREEKNNEECFTSKDLDKQYPLMRLWYITYETKILTSEVNMNNYCIYRIFPNPRPSFQFGSCSTKRHKSSSTLESPIL